MKTQSSNTLMREGKNDGRGRPRKPVCEVTQNMAFGPHGCSICGNPRSIHRDAVLPIAPKEGNLVAEAPPPALTANAQGVVGRTDVSCKLCGQPKQDWQVYCGAACSVAWEGGERDSRWRDRDRT